MLRKLNDLSGLWTVIVTLIGVVVFVYMFRMELVTANAKMLDNQARCEKLAEGIKADVESQSVNLGLLAEHIKKADAHLEAAQELSLRISLVLDRLEKRMDDNQLLSRIRTQGEHEN